MSTAAPPLPTVYLNHGGGPLPLLDRQPHVATSLRRLATLLPRPSALLVLSAHYITPTPTLLTSPSPDLLYDYYNFPPPAYSIKYPAPGHPTLAKQVAALLENAGIEYDTDADRGFDHGVFVPLKIMYPDADIPILSLSHPASAPPAQLWALGAALSPLRKQNVLIIGSGASFHNFDAFFRPAHDRDGRLSDQSRSRLWDQWLRETATLSDALEREKRFKRWVEAPCARFAHPTPEHFTPMLIVVAAAAAEKGEVFEGGEMGELAVSQFVFGAE
eukprot:GFKZ01001284.1.p1 GENE.GFKZ01001284.1~~GFKZ01001284.1.p1  ORF type:complete len:274 (-),score=38.81 GFKZ01001284.1:557-1378(-)